MRQSERERVRRVLGIRRLLEAQDGGDHPRDLALVRGPVADQRLLGDRGGELDHLGAEGRCTGEGDASPLADPERRLDVLGREGALDDDHVRPDALQDLHDPRLDLPEPLGHGPRAPATDRAGVEEARTLPMSLDGAESDDPRAWIDAEDDRRRRTGRRSAHRTRGCANGESRGGEHALRESSPRGKGFLPHRLGPYALPAPRERPRGRA